MHFCPLSGTTVLTQDLLFSPYLVQRKTELHHIFLGLNRIFLSVSVTLWQKMKKTFPGKFGSDGCFLQMLVCVWACVGVYDGAVKHGLIRKRDQGAGGDRSQSNKQWERDRERQTLHRCLWVISVSIARIEARLIVVRWRLYHLTPFTIRIPPALVLCDMAQFPQCETCVVYGFWSCERYWGDSEHCPGNVGWFSENGRKWIHRMTRPPLHPL